MKESYTITFLTPCFCSGAQQDKAEARASAIRGELRWWFRVLGGSREEERKVFGGLDPKGKPLGSSFRVRFFFKKESSERWWEKKSGGAYLWYFLKDSKPPRWQEKGAIAPGSTCLIELFWQRDPGQWGQGVFTRWSAAKEAFLHFGSLGYRATRCAGAFQWSGAPTTEEEWKRKIEELLRPAGFRFDFPQEVCAGDWRRLIKQAEQYLKNLREKNPARKRSKPNPTPLGLDSPRQRSALLLRPVQVASALTKYRHLVLEAPHSRVLGEKTRSVWPTGPILKQLA